MAHVCAHKRAGFQSPHVPRDDSLTRPLHGFSVRRGYVAIRYIFRTITSLPSSQPNHGCGEDNYDIVLSARETFSRIYLFFSFFFTIQINPNTIKK